MFDFTCRRPTSHSSRLLCDNHQEVLLRLVALSNWSTSHVSLRLSRFRYNDPTLGRGLGQHLKVRKSMDVSWQCAFLWAAKISSASHVVSRAKFETTDVCWKSMHCRYFFARVVRSMTALFCKSSLLSMSISLLTWTLLPKYIRIAARSASKC